MERHVLIFIVCYFSIEASTSSSTSSTVEIPSNTTIASTTSSQITTTMTTANDSTTSQTSFTSASTHGSSANSSITTTNKSNDSLSNTTTPSFQSTSLSISASQSTTISPPTPLSATTFTPTTQTQSTPTTPPTPASTTTLLPTTTSTTTIYSPSSDSTVTPTETSTPQTQSTSTTTPTPASTTTLLPDTTSTAIIPSPSSDSTVSSTDTSTTQTQSTSTTTLLPITTSVTTILSPSSDSTVTPTETSTTQTQSTSTTTPTPAATTISSPSSDSTVTLSETSTTQTQSTSTTTPSQASTTTLLHNTTSTTTIPTSTFTSESSSLSASTTQTYSQTTTPVPDCGQPPTLEKGQKEYSSTSVGSVVKYKCNPGYNITGKDSVTCQQNGSWEPLSATCSPLDCGFMDSVANATITYFPQDATYYGALAWLQCLPGFAVSDTTNNEASCSENGTWDRILSSNCTLIECRTVDPPGNGFYNLTNNRTGSEVQFQCNPGYTLLGFQSQTCLDSGEWSGSSPNCVKTPAKPATPCPDDDDNRKMKWNTTQAGKIISIPCSSHNQNLSGVISRNCTDKGIWLLPNYNCTRKAFEGINRMVNVIKGDPTEERVENVLENLSNISSQSPGETIYGGEIRAITAALDVIASINYTNVVLTESQSHDFFETTSNLLDPNNAESWQSIDQEPTEDEEVSGAAKVLDVVSTYADAISDSLTESSPYRNISVDNLVLEVRRLNNSENITFSNENDEHGVASTLVLSHNALNGSTKYSAVIYKNLSGVLSTKASFNREILGIGSSVMTVNLDKWEENNNFAITMKFRHFTVIHQERVLPTCTYRNESSNVWETDGCVRKSHNLSMTVCECNHLTNFAILMSPWTEDNVDTKAIRIISIVGCSVSMLGLVVTMLLHLCYWRYVKSDRVKILMNLCIALLISYGLFLGGVDRTSNKDVCTTMAVLLQYVYLVVFFLMLAEGIEISVVVLYVFTTKSRLKWILPCAWLIPALIVGISLAVTQAKGYGNAEFCWLSVDNGLIWAFVGPALLIILINFVLLLFVIKTIMKTKTLSQKSNKERTITGIRCLCVLLPLVGCTWVIGIFYVNESMAWIQYVFAVCNSLQGLAIFIFHCALNKQIRHAYKRLRMFSESGIYTRSTSNPLILPRAKPSKFATDLYDNSYSGTETSLHHRRSFHEVHENRAYVETDMDKAQVSYNIEKFDFEA